MFRLKKEAKQAEYGVSRTGPKCVFMILLNVNRSVYFKGLIYCLYYGCH